MGFTGDVLIVNVPCRTRGLIFPLLPTARVVLDNSGIKSRLRDHDGVDGLMTTGGMRRKVLREFATIVTPDPAAPESQRRSYRVNGPWSLLTGRPQWP